MPRKKPRGEEQTLEAPVLMLPPPTRIPPHRAHERAVDPYETPAGAVPGKVSNARTTGRKPLERKLNAEEQHQQLALQEETRVKRERYEQWLDALIEHGGDRVEALVQMTSLSAAEVRTRMSELVAYMHEGRGASEITEILEQNDLDVVARARVLRKWLYSDNAAASLNSIKLLQENDGAGGEVGSFESYMRMAKLQSGKA